MTIFAEINQMTMRKIFLLLVTSLVLFACEKEAPEQVTDENGSTPDIFEPTIVPMGALPGKFTVNAEGKQVYFSKGISGMVKLKV